MANLKSGGEWGFLNHLLPRLRRQDARRFVVPPGDDAAVLKTPAGAVLSIDGLTEGTHFKSGWAKTVQKTLGVGFGRALGWKLLGAGLSDLAAMGRTKNRWAMVYLAATPKTEMKFLKDLYQGVREACSAGETALVGGDTVRGKDLSLVVAVGGEMASKPIGRGGANVGDALCVTGPVGDAQKGLQLLLKNQKSISMSDKKYFITRFFKPTPRFEEAEVLGRFAGVTSLMDLSDPLGSSVKILAQASRVGADVWIETVPVSPPLRRALKNPSALLSAGEDYGLLFTVRQNRLRELRQKMRFSVVGAIRPRSKGVRAYLQDKQVRPHGSFEHFA